MKKNAKVLAKNEDYTMEVTIRFRATRYSLTKNETKKVVTSAANGIADAVRALPYTQFGPHNTRVKV